MALEQRIRGAVPGIGIEAGRLAGHQILLARNGIFIHENAATEPLAAAKVYQFAYVFNPLAIKGSTGSPDNAMAVH